MCGFVGGTGTAWNYPAALETIAHRGPDASKLHLDGAVKVGFRRVSIIDLGDEANQPMFASDGATWLVFNGEIYGFRALRKELEKRGHVFRTSSDTEVVLQSYLEWGDGFVEHLDGMFAIVIWDARQRRLKLSRDRPGIKPLYYYHDGKNFAFASELKAIEKRRTEPGPSASRASGAHKKAARTRGCRAAMRRKSLCQRVRPLVAGSASSIT